MFQALSTGVYVLLIRLPRRQTLAIGKTARRFDAGWYAYVGRAMGGLRGRLARHLRTSHVRHWHVDALLAAGQVADVQVRSADAPEVEIALAREVGDWPLAAPVPGFGAGDSPLDTHLFRFARAPSQSLLAGSVLPHLPAMFAWMGERYENHALWERDPFHTLVSCILSLRTRDPVTDAAAERLLGRLDQPADFVSADPEGIARLIYPVGMYRQKARTLIRIASMIVHECEGRTPSEIGELLRLPGVGRKTANLVRSFAFHLPALCVDTHVHRITNRWGLVRTRTPEETELELRRILPERYWAGTNPFLVQHGQRVCLPGRPRCGGCGLSAGCQYLQLLAADRLLGGVPGAPLHPSLAGLSRHGPAPPRGEAGSAP